MWTSRQTKTGATGDVSARVGVVTAGGQENGVHLGTQRRWLPIMAPGGYRWRPRTGEQVLVLKTGEQGESACVLARQETPEEDLQPGEVELYAPDCSVKLTGTGRVELCGSIYINGQPLEDVIRRAVAGQEG